jgi:ArsR family transcriptional regulator
MSKQEPQGAVVPCCTPIGVDPMSAVQADRITVLLKALADPIRLRLMSMIAAADEICVCDLLGPFDVSQPTISHHLKVLHEAGLLEREKRGVWVYYRAQPAALTGLATLIGSTLP